MKASVFLLPLLIFISIQVASAGIFLSGEDAKYEASLSSVSIPTQVVKIKSIFLSNADATTEINLNAVSIPTKPSPLKEIFLSNADAVFTQKLTPMKTVQEPPIASFTFVPSQPTVGQSVTFDASQSYDPDGYIVSYGWDFGDGSKEITTSPTIQHSYSMPGTYTVTLTVTDNDGLTNSTSMQVEVTSVALANLTMSPQTVVISPDSTSTIDIVLDKAPTGLSYVNITVNVDPSIAQIESVSFPSWASLKSNSTLPSSTAWFKAGDLNDQVKTGDTNVVLATLTIKGLAEGTSDITITVNSFQDDNYQNIEDQIATVSGTVTVVSGPPPIDGHQPKDLDGDGLYEDVNGDGQFNFGDVIFFFMNFDKDETKNHPEYYDFNNDGSVNFGDVVALFKML